MRKFFFTLLFTVLTCSGISASAQSYTNINWQGQKIADKKFWTLTTGLGVTSLVDVRNTFQNQALGYQVNPIMRPLVNAGKIPAYATVGGIDVGIAALSYEGKKRHWKFWYLPESIGIGAHGVAFAWNIKLAGR